MIVHSCELFPQSKQWCSVCDEARLFMSALLLSLRWICWRLFSTEHHRSWCAPLGFWEPLAGLKLPLFKLFDVVYVSHFVLNVLHLFVMSLQADWQIWLHFHTACLQCSLLFSIIRSREEVTREGLFCYRNCWSVTEDFQEAITTRHVSVLLAIMLTASKNERKGRGERLQSCRPSMI